MSDHGSSDAVVDDTHDNRFELGPEGESGELVYRRNGNRLVLVHTEVREALRGRGLGGRLVRAAVERAAAESMTVVPVCSYAARVADRSPGRGRDRRNRLEPSAGLTGLPPRRWRPQASSP